ncbi:MAG: hypothetical protein H6722_22605 [Sandaracinus sp.]|nr:hypothetical protein [Sandaracinus sp.]MCB9620972.1 hypothetical protein [Sandaracinus sp.]MCB9621603.1 hypothetical protein [Sandaracinus sp.]MCB9625237.1 hypothetical protein [Sandaracinus sp.]
MKLLYPLFGLTVIGGYAGLQLTGTDPFAAGTERVSAPPGVHAAAGPRRTGVGYVGRSYRYGK